MSIDNKSQSQKIIWKEFDKSESLPINITYGWPDGLTLKVIYFSHKEPVVDGPTKTTAYIQFQKAGEKGEITLSVHGTEGKSKVTYDKLQWKNYSIELLSFDYDHSIEVKIHKGAGNNEVGYFINDQSVAVNVFEEMKNSLAEMKGTWYCTEFNDGGETGYKGIAKDGKVYRYKSISRTKRIAEVLEQE